MPTFRLLSTLALAVALAICAAAPAGAHARMELGLQDDRAFLGDATRSAALDRADALGVTRLRVNFAWARLMPADQAAAHHELAAPRYEFAPYDALVDAAAARGIRIQPTLTGPVPAYASTAHRVGVTSPDAKAFGRYAAAVAAHFAGRVDRYSIWNEPNWHSQLLPASKAPGLYRGLFTAGYAAIKARDSHAKVLIGETAPYRQAGRSVAPLAFLRAVTCTNARYKRTGKCKPLTADGYAHHPYDFTHKPSNRFKGADNVTIGTLGRLSTALDRLAKARALRTPSGHAPRIYLTEFGYFSQGSRKLPVKTRASYLTQALTRAQRDGHVRQLVYYMLYAQPTQAKLWDTGLLGPSASGGPVYDALVRWSAQARRSGRLTRASGPLALPTAR